mgnify:CR=1 FL=1
MKKAMNQSKRISILNTISVLVLMLTLLLVFLNISYSSRLSKATNNRTELTENANVFMDASAYLTNEVRAYASTSIQEHYDNYMNELNTLRNRESSLAKMQEIGITAEEQGLIDKMAGISDTLVPFEEDAMEQAHRGENDKALAYVYGDEYSSAISQINDIKKQFLKTLSNRTTNEVMEITKKSAVNRFMMFASVIVVCAIQFVIMRFVRKDVLVPVLTVRDQMAQIASGNLSADFPLEPDTSEIGRLIASIHETRNELKHYIKDIDSNLAQMADGNMDLVIDSQYRGEFLPIQKAMTQIVDALNIALSQICETTEAVADEAEQMASDAQVLSDGAIRQASTVQELSSSIQALSGEVRKTSDDAEEARRCSLAAAGKLETCNEKMSALASAINDISVSSEEISGIVKTIQDISLQTKILALNASVEAARAGAAGKGFAVVANEVQSLANKSAVAAQNITRLIGESMRLVHHGTALTADTTDALTQTVIGAKQATQLIEQIATSAMQQSNSLSCLTDGMGEINEVIQTNAETAEKSASAAGQLREQAEELKVSVERFNLRH